MKEGRIYEARKQAMMDGWKKRRKDEWMKEGWMDEGMNE
jgi:hypothetical protein